MRQLAGILVLAMFLSGCQVGDASIFAARTYVDEVPGEVHPLGPVSGLVCQRYWLYLLPGGEAPTTRAALEQAMAVEPGTRFLANMSVDNRMEIGIGYLDDCILVEGIAHGSPNTL